MPLPKRGTKQNRLSVAAAIVALVCAFGIESLHGHACAGDGCLLCLVAALARMTLFASIGVALVLPVIRVLTELQVVRVSIWPDDTTRTLPPESSRTGHVELTPVTMGVRLII